MSDPQEVKRGRGRPRKYPVDVAQDGAPAVTVRVQPEMKEWLRRRGGAEYARKALEGEAGRMTEMDRFSVSVHRDNDPSSGAGAYKFRTLDEAREFARTQRYLCQVWEYQGEGLPSRLVDRVFPT